MAKRELLMLAHRYDPRKHKVAGWYVSEKLDGQRALWDGGVTRGVNVARIPWANTQRDRHDNYKCTGLWSRGGKVIHAPEWWLDTLPHGRMLDGELYIGRHQFQQLRSIVARSVNTDDVGWQRVDYRVFGFPNPEAVFADACFDTAYYQREVTYDNVASLFRNTDRWPLAFAEALHAARNELPQSDYLRIHEQHVLPSTKAYWHIMSRLDEVQSGGGEGLMLRNPHEPWVGRRAYSLLKVKPQADAEGTIIGYLTGKLTAKDSRNLGCIGSLIVQWRDGVTFALSGLNDIERCLPHDAQEWACDNPGKPLPDTYEAVEFRRGQQVTFKYNGVTRDGLPKEARYWRKFQSE